jgi:hypothetical protein
MKSLTIGLPLPSSGPYGHRFYNRPAVIIVIAVPREHFDPTNLAIEAAGAWRTILRGLVCSATICAAKHDDSLRIVSHWMSSAAVSMNKSDDRLSENVEQPRDVPDLIFRRRFFGQIARNFNLRSLEIIACGCSLSKCFRA